MSLRIILVILLNILVLFLAIAKFMVRDPRKWNNIIKILLCILYALVAGAVIVYLVYLLIGQLG